MSKQHVFEADRRVQIQVRRNGKYQATEVLAETITQTGNCIVITAHELKDGQTAYGLTHTLTGGSLSSNSPLFDIPQLKKAARAFWRSLDKDQKKLWKTCKDHRKLAAGTPQLAVKQLKEDLG